MTSMSHSSQSTRHTHDAYDHPEWCVRSKCHASITDLTHRDAGELFVPSNHSDASLVITRVRADEIGPGRQEVFPTEIEMSIVGGPRAYLVPGDVVRLASFLVGHSKAL